MKLHVYAQTLKAEAEQIKKDLKKNVKVNAIRKKPYFQDV